jgi:nucleoside-diphosphate-sugar epimerase
VADITKARELGFQPRTPFKEGVQRTVKWWTDARLKAEEAALAATRGPSA